jgi:hypothetical protein
VETLVGIDHGFSFPIAYFDRHHLPRDWPTFLVVAEVYPSSWTRRFPKNGRDGDEQGVPNVQSPFAGSPASVGRKCPLLTPSFSTGKSIISGNRSVAICDRMQSIAQRH